MPTVSDPLFSLEDVINAPEFPDVDLALRRGRHLDADDGALYTYLLDAEEHLVAFYARFECQLLHKPDGYFYLLPTGDRLGRRHLGPTEMLVGQSLVILYLDPITLEKRGVVSMGDILSHLATLIGTEALVRALYPKRKRYDQRVAEETARARVFEAIRKLGTLGFVHAHDDEHVQLRRPLLRFAEVVRTDGDPAAEMARLAAAGELVLQEPDEEEETEPVEPEEDA
jgi:chromosome partition protein MukE